MKPFDPDLLDMLDAGQVDYRDAIELVFDSGVVRMFIGGRGQFAWDDAEGLLPPWMMMPGLWMLDGGTLSGTGFVDFSLDWDEPAPGLYLSGTGYVRFGKSWDGVNAPEAVFHGGGSLVSLDVPANALGSESRAITARVLETHMVEGSDVPVNTFDDDVRATIDEEPWQGRPAVLSIFWIGPSGLPIYREQVAVREMDAMPIDTDQDGNPVRSLVLEEPDITQRDVEGKTANAAFQALVDPTDRAFEHVGTTVRQMQKINFGRIEGAA